MLTVPFVPGIYATIQYRLQVEMLSEEHSKEKI